MSKAQSNLRLVVYVGLAMLTFVVGGIDEMREADMIAWVKFIGGALISGGIVIRAFIDKSVTEVVNKD